MNNETPLPKSMKSGNNERQKSDNRKVKIRQSTERQKFHSHDFSPRKLTLAR